jgi:hypothetical protein
MKRYVVPTQAFIALCLCAGMVWMLFVVAGINPAPPTTADLQARNTQDLSFADMNRTAVALAKNILANLVPSPTGRILLPVTGGETATPSPVAAITLKAVSTFANMLTPFAPLTTPFPATATRRKPDRLAYTMTNPPTAVPFTATSIPPSVTPVRATVTVIPPTQTPTDPAPTNTPKPTATRQPTNTPIPPASTTPKPTITPMPTNPPRPTPTSPPPTEPPPTNPPPTNPPPTEPPPTDPPATNPPPTEPPPTQAVP